MWQYLNDLHTKTDLLWRVDANAWQTTVVVDVDIDVLVIFSAVSYINKSFTNTSGIYILDVMLWLPAVGLSDSVNVHFWPNSFLMFILLTYTHSLGARVLVVVCYIDWCLRHLIIWPALAHSQCSKSCCFVKSLSVQEKHVLEMSQSLTVSACPAPYYQTSRPSMQLSEPAFPLPLPCFLFCQFLSWFCSFSGLFSSSSISLHVCDWGRTVVVHWM